MDMRCGDRVTTCVYVCVCDGRGSITSNSSSSSSRRDSTRAGEQEVKSTAEGGWKGGSQHEKIMLIPC